MLRTRVTVGSLTVRPLAALIAITSVLAITSTGVSGRAAEAHAAAAVASAHPGIYHPVTPARALDGTAGAGGTLAVAVLGSRGVPAAGVGAVVLNVTAARPARGGYVTAFPSGSARPATSNLNFTAGRTVANLVVVPVGANGQVSLYNASSGSTRLVADVSGYYEAGAPTDAGAFGALVPSRVLDTRIALGAPASSAVSHGVASVQVAGAGGVPMTGASAVVLNVTVATPQSSGYATVYPSGGARPGTSSLNFPPARTVANLVTVKLGADGKVNLYNGSAGSVRFVADVFGYYLAGTPSRAGTFQPLTPARIMDTRNAIGVSKAIAAGATAQLDVGGKGGLPPYGGGAVALNVTVTGGTASGYLTVWPTGGTRPRTSNLNFTSGQTVANLVIVRPSETGRVSFTNSSTRPVHVIADSSGSFVPVPAIHFRGTEPVRVAGGRLSVSCGGAGLCMATTGSGLIARFDGTAWHQAHAFSR